MSGSLRNQIQVLYLVGLFLLCSTELRGKQTDFLPFMVLRNSRNLYKIYYSKKFSLFWKNIEIWNNLVFLIGLFLVVYCYTVFKAIRPISTGNNSQCVLKNLFIIIYFIILFNSDYNEQHCELFNIWPYLSCSTDLWGINRFFALDGNQELKKFIQNILL